MFLIVFNSLEGNISKGGVFGYVTALSCLLAAASRALERVLQMQLFQRVISCGDEALALRQ